MIRMVKSIVIKIKMVYVVVGNSTETLVTAKEMRFLLINCLRGAMEGVEGKVKVYHQVRLSCRLQ